MGLRYEPGRLSEHAQQLRLAVRATEGMMQVLADYVVQKIIKRTYEDGLDKFGQPFAPYSTRPMYISRTSLYFNLAEGIGRTERLPSVGPRVSYLPKKGGQPGQMRRSTSYKLLGVAFDAGYAQFKQGLGDSVVNLTVRGEMLGALGYDCPFGIVYISATTLSIDFTRPDQRFKAQGHVERGRDFWGALIIEAETTEAKGLMLARWHQEFPEGHSDG